MLLVSLVTDKDVGQPVEVRRKGMTDNIVTAAFSGGRRTRTEHLWQYDYGQVLRITGLELPETFEVHFSNTRDRGAAKTSIGTAEAVSIPDEFLTSGADIYAWVFLHTGADDGETEYMIIIPVRRRAKPSDDAPTPQEQSAITQAIAALNSAVVDVQEAVDAAADARTSAASAEASATAAAASEASVEADADRASEAAAAAETAQAGAETAQTGAESARDAAAQVLESIPADYTELSDSVSDLKSDFDALDAYVRDLSPVVTTGPSPMVSVTDAAPLDADSVIVTIEPVQAGSGDPSPENVRAITGWTGANVWRTGKNLLTHDAIYDFFANSTTGSVFYDGENDTFTMPSGHGNILSDTAKRAKMSYPFHDGSRYIIMLRCETTNVPNISVYYKNGRSASITKAHSQDVVSGENWFCLITSANQNVDFIRFNRDSTGSHVYYLSEFVIAECTETAIWRDYYLTQDGQTYPITWESEAGTVYGGTLDVTNGALTVTDGYIASYAGETLPGVWISDRDVYSAGVTPTNGAQVVYKLATPVTYILTPLQIAMLRGTNNLWADTGDVTLTYRKDVATLLSALTAPDETDMTANTNYAVNSFFTVGGTLYKATAAIASGETIQPGTNCAATSIAEQLTYLNSQI